VASLCPLRPPVETAVAVKSGLTIVSITCVPVRYEV
jgi:hypothetical protein